MANIFTLTTNPDTFTGLAGADNFFDFIPSTLQAGDTITGGGSGSFIDVMRMTSGGTIAAGQFLQVTDIEELRLSAGSDVTLTNGLVGGSSLGYFIVYDSAGDDTVDASAVTATPISFFGNAGGADTFKGGNGDDNFLFGAADLTSADTVVGGGGFDKLALTTAGTVDASAFTHVSGVEALALSPGGNNVTLTNGLVSGSSLGYFVVYDGAGDDTVDGSAITNNTAIAFFGSGGADTFKGGNGDDSFLFGAADLTSADTVVGGGGFDKLALTTAGTVDASAFTHVSGVEALALSPGGNNVTLTNGLVGGSSLGYFIVYDGAGDDTADGSGVTNNTAIAFFGNAGGADTFKGGNGDDNFLFGTADLTSSDTVVGGGGFDKLSLTTAGTVLASAFTNVSGLEALVLNGAGNNVTLSYGLLAGTSVGHFTVYDGAGDDTVDASFAENNTPIAFFASGGADTFKGSQGDDSFLFGTADLTSADTVVGGGGFDKLVFTTAGTVDASAFTHVSGVEALALSPGGNNVTLTNGLVGGSSLGYLIVYDSAGDDTVDASAVTAKPITFFGNAGGADTFKGGNGDDNFLFGAADLTSADTVVGGGGFDKLVFTTAGTIDSSAFTHVSGVEALALSPGGNNVALTNGLVSGSSLGYFVVYGGAGNDTVDASAASATPIAFFGSGGSDTFSGGNADDAFYIPDSTFAGINGNGGLDRIVLTTPAQNFDLTANNAKITNTEIISLSASAGASLTLADTDIPLINADTNLLYVVGESDDNVTAGSGWNVVAVNVINDAVAPGHTFTHYHSAATSSELFIDSSITPTITAAPTAPTDADGTPDGVFETAAHTGDFAGITASAFGGTGATVTYSLSVDDSAGGFTIGSSSGVVTVADGSLIDYETAPGHAYSITVDATSGGQTSSQSFSIAVANVNEAPTTSDHTTTLPEDGAYTFQIADFSFADTADSPAPNTLTNVIISSLQTAGTLQLSGTDVTLNQAIAASEITAGHLIFTPAANVNGAGYATFGFEVQDSGGTANGGQDTSAASTMTLNVTAVNDAPTTSNNTINPSLDTTLVEDGTYAFALSDFAFSDPTDSPADTLSDVIISSLQTAGTLKLNGVAVTLNQAIAASEIAAGHLVFAPSANASGAGYSSFGFEVKDSGGTANGGQDTSAAATMTLNVTPLNDAPTTANHTINPLLNTTLTEDGAYTFQTSDFPFADTADSPASNTLANVVISSLPTAGALRLSGTDVTLNQAIPVSEITAGHLVFTPAANANGAGYATFGFEVQDNGGTANGGQDTSAAATMTLNVTAVNDAPSFTAAASDTVLEDSGPRTVAGFATGISAGPADESGQTVTFAVTGNTAPGLFSVAPTVSSNGTLTYTPLANAFGSSTITLHAHDTGGTANGGVDNSADQTFAINITGVNDAPTFTTSASTTSAEDAGAQSVSNFASSISAGPNETGQTITFNVTGDTNASLFSAGPSIAADGTLTYTANANANGTATITVVAKDDGGTTNGGVDTSTSHNFNIVVTAVNDAPTVTVPSNASVGTAFSHTDLAISGLSVADIDAGGGNVTATIGSSHGALTFDTTGLSSSATNGTHNVTLTGTLAQVNTALSTLVYNSDDGFGTDPTPANNKDTISLSVNDNGNTGSGGALGSGASTFQVGVVPQVWYIDNTGGGSGGSGTSADPFKTIHDFNASAGPGTNDYIVLRTGTGTYTGEGINLKDGQQLYGAGETLQFTNPANSATVTVLDGSGARPTINVTTAGDQGIDLASGNTIHGINITTASGTTGLDDGSGATGGSVGTLTVDHMSISGAGQAVDIDQGGALNVSLESVSATGGAEGIQLAGTAASGTGLLSGTFTAGTNSFAATSAISGSTTAGLLVGDGSGTANTGGSVAITYGGTVSAANGVRTVDIQDHSTGLVTLSGNLTHTGTGGSAIFLDGNGSSFTFSGATNNLTTGSATAVNITNQSGGTVGFSGTLNIDTSTGTGVNLATNSGITNFTGGNLTIDTTGAGNGFVATSGGTVSVTGSGNHIASAGGTALNISNTTISSSDVTFHDISAGSGSGTAGNGITLDTTGTLGGLKVTGTGTTVGSGGTIQHKTGGDGSTTAGNGIYLNNTSEVSLNGLQLNDFDNHAIFGLSVGGIKLTNSTISGTIGTSSGSNDLNLEAPIEFGTTAPSVANGFLNNSASLLDNVNVSGGIQHNVEIYQDTGTFNLTIKNSNIHDNGAALGSDGVNIETTGTSHAIIDIDHTIFSNNKSQALQASALGSSNLELTLDHNTVSKTTQGNEGFILQNGASGDLTTAVTNNTFTGILGTNILAGNVAGNATSSAELNATISNNTMTVGGIPTNRTLTGFSSSSAGQSPVSKYLIDNNTITSVVDPVNGNSQPLFVSTPDPNTSPIVYATVTNNTVNLTDVNNLAAAGQITVQSTQITSTLHADVRGNHVTGTTALGIRVRETSPAVVDLEPGAGSGTAASALATNNPGTTTGILGTVTLSANNSTALLPSNPTPPSLPAFLMAAAGGVQAVSRTPGETHLAQDQVDSVVAAAIAQWAHAGASAAQLAALAAVTFTVSDLPNQVVAEQTAGHIIIDANAADHGWFVDPTPNDNAEFTHAANAAGTDLYTDPSGAAAGHLDLLTTVTHELGHILGLGDTTGTSNVHDLMYIDLVDGERRLPDAADVAQADGASAAQIAEAALPLSAQAAANTPVIAGTAGNDNIDAGHGGNILFGGAGADVFVFGPSTPLNAATPAQITHVVDYSAAQGDTFDFSAITSAFHNSSVSDALVVRAVEDAGGKFATLQVDHIDPMAPSSAANWVNVAQLDGAQPGDVVNILIDNQSTVHLAQIHVDLLV